MATGAAPVVNFQPPQGQQLARTFQPNRPVAQRPEKYDRVEKAGYPWPTYNPLDPNGHAQFMDQLRERVKLEGNFNNDGELEERVQREAERIISSEKMKIEKGPK
jgi:hypothetical protein